MKRHTGLVTLSRDHHDGLLHAHRLQQGTRALLRLWSHDPVWQSEFIVRYYDEELAEHFRAEEHILFPLAARYIPRDNPIIDHLIRDHALMRSFIERFRSPKVGDLRDELPAFGKLLESHIRREERELFPLLEQILPDDQLHRAGKEIESAGKKAQHP